VHHAQGSDADLPDLPVHADEGHDLVKVVPGIQLQLVSPTALQYRATWGRGIKEGIRWLMALVKLGLFVLLVHI